MLRSQSVKAGLVLKVLVSTMCLPINQSITENRTNKVMQSI